MTERAAPFYCPYCGDEDLRPFGEEHGHWRCGSCRRVFRLGYIGMSRSWDAQVAEQGDTGDTAPHDTDTRGRN